MNGAMVSCIKKDLREVFRTGKLVIFLALAFGIAVMILGITLVFSDIPQALWEQLPGFNISSLEEVISSLYPKLVRESAGVYAYYIGFFYSLIVILIVHGILPSEMQKEKWVLPLQQGYTKLQLILSKCLVYGAVAGASVFAGYLFYFMVANACMERNMGLGNALILGLVHSMNLFFIVIYTELFSVLYKSPVIAAVSMIATILLVPDLAIYFSFGRLLPTYLLTFVYDSCSDYGRILPPLICNVAQLLILGLLVSMKYAPPEQA
ncbi:MAG: hypothetical protein K6E18_01185 [Lachnospiraceae bacterium]|nr:hypothetical protein [Lachnospiraceae bacterium]